jgi:hypothetical protein
LEDGAKTHARGVDMSTKPTLKQKEKLFRERQNPNFMASSQLDGLQIDQVRLSDEQIAQRLDDLRAHYER